jgi:hypothetical protein
MDSPINRMIDRASNRKAASSMKAKAKRTVALNDQVLSLVAEANATALPERQVTPRAALIVMSRAMKELSSLPDESRTHGVLREVSKFISLNQKTLLASASIKHADLLPKGHPLSPLNASLTDDDLRKKYAEWIAADPAIADEARPLVAMAHSLPPESIEREHAFLRLRTLQASAVPAYFKIDDVTALVASFMSGNSSAARRARVALQWRDRFGRWIEMGRGVNFRFRLPDGSIATGRGNYVGAGSNPRVERTSTGTSLVSDTGLIEVSGVPGLQPGLYSIDSKNAAAYQARIPGFEAPQAPSFEDQFDADIPSISDLQAVRRELPIGWKKQGPYYVSDDNYAVVPGPNGQPQMVTRLNADGRPAGTIGNARDWNEVNSLIEKDQPEFDKEIARIEAEGEEGQLPLARIPGATEEDVVNFDDIVNMQKQRAEENKKFDAARPAPKPLGDKDLNGNVVPNSWTRDANDDMAYTRQMPQRDGGTYPLTARVTEDGKYIAGHAAGWIPEPGTDGRGASRKFESWEEIESSIPEFVDYLNEGFTEDNPVVVDRKERRPFGGTDDYLGPDKTRKANDAFRKSLKDAKKKETSAPQGMTLDFADPEQAAEDAGLPEDTPFNEIVKAWFDQNIKPVAPTARLEKSEEGGITPSVSITADNEKDLLEAFRVYMGDDEATMQDLRDNSEPYAPSAAGYSPDDLTEIDKSTLDALNKRMREDSTGEYNMEGVTFASPDIGPYDYYPGSVVMYPDGWEPGDKIIGRIDQDGIIDWESDEQYDKYADNVREALRGMGEGSPAEGTDNLKKVDEALAFLDEHMDASGTTESGAMAISDIQNKVKAGKKALEAGNIESALGYFDDAYTDLDNGYGEEGSFKSSDAGAEALDLLDNLITSLQSDKTSGGGGGFDLGDYKNSPKFIKQANEITKDWPTMDYATYINDKDPEFVEHKYMPLPEGSKLIATGLNGEDGNQLLVKLPDGNYILANDTLDNDTIPAFEEIYPAEVGGPGDRYGDNDLSWEDMTLERLTSYDPYSGFDRLDEYGYFERFGIPKNTDGDGTGDGGKKSLEDIKAGDEVFIPNVGWVKVKRISKDEKFPEGRKKDPVVLWRLEYEDEDGKTGVWKWNRFSVDDEGRKIDGNLETRGASLQSDKTSGSGKSGARFAKGNSGDVIITNSVEKDPNGAFSEVFMGDYMEPFNTDDPWLDEVVKAANKLGIHVDFAPSQSGAYLSDEGVFRFTLSGPNLTPEQAKEFMGDGPDDSGVFGGAFSGFEGQPGFEDTSWQNLYNALTGGPTKNTDGDGPDEPPSGSGRGEQPAGMELDFADPEQAAEDAGLPEDTPFNEIVKAWFDQNIKPVAPTAKLDVAEQGALTPIIRISADNEEDLLNAFRVYFGDDEATLEDLRDNSEEYVPGTRDETSITVPADSVTIARDRDDEAVIVRMPDGSWVEYDNDENVSPISDAQRKKLIKDFKGEENIRWRDENGEMFFEEALKGDGDGDSGKPVTYNDALKLSKDTTLTPSQKLHGLFGNAKTLPLKDYIESNDLFQDRPIDPSVDINNAEIVEVDGDGQVVVFRYPDNTYHTMDAGGYTEIDGVDYISSVGIDALGDDAVNDYFRDLLDAEDPTSGPFYRGYWIDQEFQKAFVESFPDDEDGGGPGEPPSPGGGTPPKAPSPSTPGSPALFEDFDKPAGAFQLRTTEYEPEGRIDEASTDFTDDPRRLATKFSLDDLVTALTEALIGRPDEDVMQDILNANVGDNDDLPDLEDLADVAGSNAPRANANNASGAGALEFNAGEEYVQAEALYNAVYEAGGDPNRVIANAYDAVNGNRNNTQKLLDAQGGVSSPEEVQLIEDITDEIRQIKDATPEGESPVANQKSKPEKKFAGSLIENVPVDYDNPDYFDMDSDAYIPAQPEIDENGYTDNPEILALDYESADLIEQMLEGITDGSGVALLDFGGEDGVHEVPIEALRDAIQLQDINTNDILFKLRDESNDMSEEPKPEQPSGLPEQVFNQKIKDKNDGEFELNLVKIGNVYEGALISKRDNRVQIVVSSTSEKEAKKVLKEVGAYIKQSANGDEAMYDSAVPNLDNTDSQAPRTTNLQAHSQMIKDLIEQTGATIDDEKADQIRDAIDQEGLLDWSEADDAEIIEAITEVAGTSIFGQAPTPAAERRFQPSPGERQAIETPTPAPAAERRFPPTTGERQAIETPTSRPARESSAGFSPFSDAVEDMNDTVDSNIVESLDRSANALVEFFTARVSRLRFVAFNSLNGEIAVRTPDGKTFVIKDNGVVTEITTMDASAVESFFAESAPLFGWEPIPQEVVDATITESIRRYQTTSQEPTPEAPEVESEVPVEPEAPAAEVPVFTYPGPREAGYTANNTTLASDGSVIGAGSIVVANRDGKRGVVVSIQNNPEYARIRFEDGKIAVRSANQIKAVSNPDGTLAMLPSGAATPSTATPSTDVESRLDAPITPAPNVARSGAAWGINDTSEIPDFIAPLVQQDVSQSDFSAWGERDAEIAKAASTRATLDSLIALLDKYNDALERGENVSVLKPIKEEVNKILTDVYGGRNGVSFGVDGYTISVVSASSSVAKRDQADGRTVNTYDLSISFYLKDKSGQTVGEGSRSISIEDSTDENGNPVRNSFVKNNLLKVYGSNKKKGFASAYNRYMENWYIANGIDKVKVYAAGGGGSWQGAFVWALNGFDWDNSYTASELVRALERGARTPEEKAIAKKLADKANAAGGDVNKMPTPLEVALAGWYPGAKKWFGKDVIIDRSWNGIKHLNPTAREQIQAINYNQIKNAERRIQAGQNKAGISAVGLAQVMDNSFQTSNPELSPYMEQIRDALKNNRSLAVLSPAAKSALGKFVSKELLNKDSNMPIEDLFRLRTALSSEYRAENDYANPFGAIEDALAGFTVRDFYNTDRLRAAGFISKTLTGDDSGVNSTFMVTHEPSGQVFFVKEEQLSRSYYGNRGLTSEVEANTIMNALEMMGVPSVRGSRVNDDVIIMSQAGATLPLAAPAENASTMMNYGITDADGDIFASDSGANFVDLLHSPEDVFNMAIVDMLGSGYDRHDANWMAAFDKTDNRLFMFPIDNSLLTVNRNESGIEDFFISLWPDAGDVYKQAVSRIIRSAGEERAAEIFMNQVRKLITNLDNPLFQPKGEELAALVSKWGSYDAFKDALKTRLTTLVTPGSAENKALINSMKMSYWR